MADRSLPVREAVRAQNLLGEGPLWDVDRGGLWWLDLKRRTIDFWTPEADEHRTWPVPGLVGSAALRPDGRLLVAGSMFWDFDPSAPEPFTVRAAMPTDEPTTNRFNDGRVDTQGRFVVGTMDDAEVDRSGALYRITDLPHADVDAILDRLDARHLARALKSLSWLDAAQSAAIRRRLNPMRVL